MTLRTRAAFAVLLLLAAAGAARADTRRKLSFEGRLADPAGTPLAGSYTITFAIVDAPSGGTTCHSESQTITLDDGYLRTCIGCDGGTVTGISDGCTFADPQWLEIGVGGETLSPRVPLISAGYSLDAEKLIGPDGVPRRVAIESGGIPFSDTIYTTDLNSDLWDNHHWLDIDRLLAAAARECGDPPDGIEPTALYKCRLHSPSPGVCNDPDVTGALLCLGELPLCPAGCTEVVKEMGCEPGRSCEPTGNSRWWRWARSCICPATTHGFAKPNVP